MQIVNNFSKKNKDEEFYSERCTQNKGPRLKVQHLHRVQGARNQSQIKLWNVGFATSTAQKKEGGKKTHQNCLLVKLLHLQII